MTTTFTEAALEARVQLYSDDPDRGTCLRLARRAYELAPDRHHATNWQRWIDALESGRRIKMKVHQVEITIFDADPVLVAEIEDIFRAFPS